MLALELTLVIGPNVEIGENSIIQSHVSIWTYQNWKK